MIIGELGNIPIMPGLSPVTHWILILSAAVQIPAIVLWLIFARSDSVKRIFNREWHGRERRGTEV